MRRYVAVGCASILCSCAPMVNKELEESSLAKISEPVRFVDGEPVRVIESKSYFVRDNLNRSIPFDWEAELSVYAGEKLGDAVKRLGLPVVVSPSLAELPSPSHLNFKGDVRRVLDALASLYGLYWTYDRGVIRFVREKTLVYSIPLLANDKLFATYKLTSENRNFVEVERIKKDLFEEIEEKLGELLRVEVYGEERFEGERVYSFERKEGSLESYERADENKRQSLESEERGEGKKRGREKVKEKDKENEQGAGFKIPEPRGAQREQKLFKVFADLQKGKDLLKEKVENSFSFTFTSRKGEAKERKTEERGKLARSHERENGETGKTKVVYSVARKFGEGKRKVLVIRDAGVVMVRVTPEEEGPVRALMESILENRLNNLVAVRVFVLEVSKDFIRRWGPGMNAYGRWLLEGGVINSSLSFGSSESGFSLGFLSGSGQINAFLNFVLSESRGRLLSAPEIISLSGLPARIKSAVDFPYLEPQTISLQTGTSQLSYEIKSVSDGIEMNVTPYVAGEDVILGFALRADQYLGDKTVSAGTLGTVDLPIKAPRELFTIVRLKAGQAVVIGGIKREYVKKGYSVNSLLPTENTVEKSLEEKEILVVLVPKIIKFKGGR